MGREPHPAVRPTSEAETMVQRAPVSAEPQALLRRRPPACAGFPWGSGPLRSRDWGHDIALCLYGRTLPFSFARASGGEQGGLYGSGISSWCSNRKAT